MSRPRLKTVSRTQGNNAALKDGTVVPTGFVLDFVEVPLTSDRTVREHWTGVGDVRLESATAAQVEKAARQEVVRQIEDGAPVKHVCILTHNTVNYGSSDPEARGRRGVLSESIDRLMDLAGELGLVFRGSPLRDVRARFLEQESAKGVNGSE